MNKIIRARVIAGRFKDQVVRISNVSLDEMGRKKAACTFPDGTRANLPVTELELIADEEKAPEVKRPKTSMPFISGAASSRTLTQTKNMAKLRPEPKKAAVTKESIRKCEKCGQEYNMEARKGEAGKLTECENCAHETETKVEGTMIFSHKTGATIEIKKDGELLHEADIFDPKNKT